VVWEEDRLSSDVQSTIGKETMENVWLYISNKDTLRLAVLIHDLEFAIPFLPPKNAICYATDSLLNAVAMKVAKK